MRLAKELGIPNVNSMLRSISGQQLTEWMAYSTLEPFGEERGDLRMAIQTASLGNIFYQLWTGKQKAPFKVEDFMPHFENKEPISKEDAIAAIDAMMMAFVHASRGAPSPQPSPEGRGRRVE